MVICVCRRVSDRDIQRAVREGVDSFDGLQAELGVATACGRCASCALEAWTDACRSVTVSAPAACRGMEFGAHPA